MPSMDPFLVVADRCPQLAPRLKKKMCEKKENITF